MAHSEILWYWIGPANSVGLSDVYLNDIPVIERVSYWSGSTETCELRYLYWGCNGTS